MVYPPCFATCRLNLVDILEGSVLDAVSDNADGDNSDDRGLICLKTTRTCNRSIEAEMTAT